MINGSRCFQVVEKKEVPGWFVERGRSGRRRASEMTGGRDSISRSEPEHMYIRPPKAEEAAYCYPPVDSAIENASSQQSP